MPATIRQCIVLLDSLGTDAALLTPRLLLPHGDRPLLAWLLREFMRFGVTDFLLLTGPLPPESEWAIAGMQVTLPHTVTIGMSEAPVGTGSGGALFHARQRLGERFLLCNGDALFDCNLSDLLSAGAQDDQGVTGRILLRQPPDAPGTANSGIYLFNRRLIGDLMPFCALETDVLPRLAMSGALRSTPGQGYSQAPRLPANAAHAQHALPTLLRRRALFLDRDGVINIDHGYVGTRDRFDWVDGAREAIAYATNAGWHVFIVTNQSGVARGKYTEADVRTLLDWIADEARAAGGTIDDDRYCPYHEDATVDAYRRASDWRKPAPGMLLDLIRAWDLTPSRCVMIGDQPTDMLAAERAGVRGHLFHGGNLLEFVRPLLA